ncbi:MAG TPA: PTS glucose transporter subunit IIA [Nocardioidaceae bacterium]|nr:PTS glucose transporter subunit IIA [Nocardioidaceae bacterium]
MRVGSPVAGHSREVSEIPDPVFAKGLVGPGLAVCPERTPQKAVAPVSGVLAKLHPHAFLVVSDSGNGVLVHLGIDTVHLQGDGFELLAREGERVEAGDEIVAWDPRAVEKAGRSAVCAVVVLDCDPAAVSRQQLHVDVDRGELLFEVDC